MQEKVLKKEEIEKLNKLSFQEIKNLDEIDSVSRFILCLFEEKDELLLDMVYDNSEFDYQEFYDKFKNTSFKPFLHLLFEYQNLYFSLKEAKEQLAETLYKNYKDSKIEQLKFTNLLLFIHEKLDLSYGTHRSYKNDINRTYNTSMAYLIPVILVRYKKTTLAFRIDNKIITEMFENTQTIIHGNLTQDELVNIDERHKHQLEYLKYTFNDTEYHKGCRDWEHIFWEKFYLDKGDMLHAEYLEWKSAHIN